MGFAVLLVSGLLLIFLGLGILASPYVLTVASLIPLGISMGLAEEYFPQWKTYFKWFAAIGSKLPSPSAARAKKSPFRSSTACRS
jgi:hypothetical protein